MLQSLKELRFAPWRSAIITITIGLIALMVTFLSALTQGLAHESVSALKEVAGDDAIVISDTSSTLSGSQLDQEQVDALAQLDARPLYFARDRRNNDPITLLNWSKQEPPQDDLFLDHQPVTWASVEDIEQHRGQAVAMFVDHAHIDQAQSIAGVTVLEGNDRWNVSAAYAGEQLSLNLMIGMLYLVSMLVVGAFFIVWTLQRLHTVAVSSALGASRRILISQALIQAVIVTLIGVVIGAVGTIALISLIGDALPAVISGKTIVIPSLLVSAAALIGATLSLVPILKVDPRQALESA